MALFDITRTSSKSSDIQIAKKSVKPTRVVTTVKGGGNLLTKIQNIQKLVEEKLGHLKDKYILIQDETILAEYLDKCIANNVISIDTETTGLDPMLDDIVGICIYTPNEKGAYIPINHISYITNERVANQLDKNIIKKHFERLIENVKDIVMFNANFDIRVLRNQLGLHNIFCTWDCYLASRLLNENEPSNALKKLHQKYVLDDKEDAFTFDELFKGITFNLIPLNTAVIYAGHDPEITYELYDYQRKYLREDSDREDMRRLYWVMMNIEMPCVEVIANMEDNGILLDMKYQQELSVKYHKLLDDKLKEIYTEIDKYKDKIDDYRNGYINDYKEEVIPKYNMTGGPGYVGLDYWNPNKDAGKKVKVYNNAKLDDPINISSPTQLAVLFYDIIKVGEIDKKKPRGTGEDILKRIDIPLAKLILDYRGIEKLLSTYIDKLPNCINPNDNRIHCEFNQYGADTGRMSSSNPNLQNIPSHNKDIRKMFVASDGYVLMSSDYSQQEPSCLATFCKQNGSDKLFNARFKGNDLYSEVASACFNIPYEQCCEFDENGNKNPPEYKERRNQAKPILLGILYGRGDNSVAEQLNCSIEDAQKLKANLFRRFPEIHNFEQGSLKMARELGYVTTVCGRKRRLPDLQLDEYEFNYINGVKLDDDILDFDNNDLQTEVDERTKRRYITRLHNCRGYKERQTVKQQAKDEGIEIIDNGIKIASATRQCVNSRIQGSAADLTKLAMIDLNKNERLKELGFRLLIPVHDEVIAECPQENMKECSKLLADTMSKAAEKILKMPFSCDVEITKQWYGEEISYE